MGRSYGEVFVQLQDLVHYDKLYEISVPRLCSHHIPEGFSCRLEMRNLYTVNSSSTELEQVAYKHQTSCRSGWQRGFGELNPSPHCLLSGFQASLLFTHFRYAPNTCCSHCSKVWHYMTPHFRDQHRAVTLSRYRNRAQITVPMCEQKPYLVWFSCRRKSSLLQYERSLIM